MSLAVSQGCCSSAIKEEEEMDFNKMWVELCGEKTEFQKEKDRAREAAISSHAGRSFFKELPPDIRDLLQKLPKWKTDEDYGFAMSRYSSRQLELECVEKELKAMKELSSALACMHKDSIEVSEALAKSSANLYCELAAQVPGVKDILEYETLFSEAQKLCIEKALEEKLQKEKQTAVNLIRDPQETAIIRDPQEAAIIRVKALQTKLLVMEDKSCEESDRCVALRRLCSTVNQFVKILESELHRPRLAEKQIKKLKRGKDYARKDHKRAKRVQPEIGGLKLEESEDKKFYLVGVAIQIISLYAGPNFFKQLPSDIRDILQKFPKCETIEDLEIAMSKLRKGLVEPECLLMDLEKELKALKEISSALDCKYESCINNLQELGMSSAVVYRELVEQFPGIKDMEEYGELFTGARRLCIEKALEAKLRKGRVTTVDQILVPLGAPEIHVEDFQIKLLDNKNKSFDESDRRKILVRLRSTVKYSVKTLESTISSIMCTSSNEDNVDQP